MEDIRGSVEKILEGLRPRLQFDGGDVELVEVTADCVVRLKLTGACRGCPMSAFTLKEAIEREIRQALPQIRAVESV